MRYINLHLTFVKAGSDHLCRVADNTL